MHLHCSCFLLFVFFHFTSGFVFYQNVWKFSDSKLRAMNHKPMARKPFPQRVQRPLLNKEITSPLIRLIIPGNETRSDTTSEIVTLNEALAKSQELNLDLIMIDSHCDPPVCKVLDYDKFRYTQSRKVKDTLKNQNLHDLKIIKMTYKIEKHDYEFRLRAIQRFIEEGDKVSVLVLFKGREQAFHELGLQLLTKIIADLGNTISVENAPKHDGKTYSMTICPKKRN